MRLNERCVAEFSTSSAPTDKEGFLNKKGELNRGYQRRWFILKGNLLFYFEKRSDKEPISGVEAESWIMNHSCKIGRNHESSCLKLGNHE